MSKYSLITDIRDGLQDEWHARTTYGKLWYPVWVVFEALEIFSFLLFGLGVIAIGAFARLMDSSGQAAIAPEIYKHDETEAEE